MKKVIGITGGVGAGKSLAVSLLKDLYGADVIVADKVAAELEEKGGAAYKPLIDAFGDGILNESGDLDREALSRIIFSDAAALDKVDSIVHPLTLDEIKRRIDISDAPIIVVEAAVFPEGLRKLCDEIWFIDADEATRKKRLMTDRGYSEKKCEDIMKSQASREEFRSICDRVIDNNGSAGEIEDEISTVLGPLFDEMKRDCL